MSELDRRIAELIFGEEEPKPTELYKDHNAWRWIGDIIPSPPGQGLWITTADYAPLPFSTNLDQALRAVDKYLASRQDGAMHKKIGFWYWPARGQNATWSASFYDTFTYGQTLPEAICNLLLALIEDDNRN